MFLCLLNGDECFLAWVLFEYVLWHRRKSGEFFMSIARCCFESALDVGSPFLWGGDHYFISLTYCPHAAASSFPFDVSSIASSFFSFGLCNSVSGENQGCCFSLLWV